MPFFWGYRQTRCSRIHCEVMLVASLHSCKTHLCRCWSVLLRRLTLRVQDSALMTFSALSVGCQISLQTSGWRCDHDAATVMLVLWQALLVDTFKCTIAHCTSLVQAVGIFGQAVHTTTHAHHHLRACNRLFQPPQQLPQQAHQDRIHFKLVLLDENKPHLQADMDRHLDLHSEYNVELTGSVCRLRRSYVLFLSQEAPFLDS